MIPAILEIVAGVALLYFGAEFLVRGGVRIATGLGVTPLVIGLTLVAFATSAPELVVSVTGALRGSGDLAVGNVVGSNICNIALILGATALLCPLPVRSQLLRFDMPLLLAVSVVFAVIGWGCGGIGRIPGGIFLFDFWYGPAAADNAEVGACGCRRAVGIASHVDRQENGSDEIASAPENCKCGACQIHDAIREIVMLKAS